MRISVLVLLLLQAPYLQCSQSGRQNEEENDEMEVFVEVLVIIDQPLKEKLEEENLEPIEYVTDMFQSVNNIYKQVQPKITFYIKSVLIENENIEPMGLMKPLFTQLTKEELKNLQLPFMKYLKDPKSTSHVHAVRDLLEWKYENGYFADILVTMTGHHLCRFQIDSNFHVKDHTQSHRIYSCADSYERVRITEGGACDQNRNAAVVEIKRTHEDANILAHEIGHLLMVNEPGCFFNPKYVLFDEKNRWSNCSMMGFRKYIPRLSCLKEKPIHWFSGSRVIYFFGVLTIFVFLFGLAHYVYYFNKRQAAHKVTTNLKRPTGKNNDLEIEATGKRPRGKSKNIGTGPIGKNSDMETISELRGKQLYWETMV